MDGPEDRYQLYSGTLTWACEASSVASKRRDKKGEEERRGERGGGQQKSGMTSNVASHAGWAPCAVLLRVRSHPSPGRVCLARLLKCYYTTTKTKKEKRFSESPKHLSRTLAA